ncbi:MAG TPA: DciA family protein [Acidimicrobiales bacterium]
MEREPPGPRPLAWSLSQVASRVKRLDLVGFAAVEAAWSAVGSATASGAQPMRLAGGELTVAVVSGAHASRARRDTSAMLVELAAAMAEPPTSVRVVVRPSGTAPSEAQEAP